jgi:chemotaxis methyl-accepting protein methylase
MTQCPTHQHASQTLAQPRADDRFRHVLFLGDVPGIPGAAPRPAMAGADPPGADSLDPEAVRFFTELCVRAGMEADRYRESIFMRRHAACLRALRARSTDEALRAIQKSGDGRDRALSAVMIGVTSFFRDPGVFRTLDEQLPALAARRGFIDALSVGCSDGAELYSLAMLLRDRGLLAHSRLWGTDCRNEAVAAAREGVFAPGAVAEIPPGLRARHLRPLSRAERGRRAPSSLRVVDELRAPCAWVPADAFDLPGPPTIPRVVDLVLCRNLAIYLTPAAAHELWELLVARLRPGGLLVVGKAERPSCPSEGLLSRVGACVYRKLEEAR